MKNGQQHQIKVSKSNNKVKLEDAFINYIIFIVKLYM